MDENLYTDSSFGPEMYSAEYIEVLSRMDKLEAYLRTVPQKNKRKKKRDSNHKKIMRRLKTLEKENAQLRCFLKVVVTQLQASQKQPWWLRAFKKSTPKLVDLITAIVKNKNYRSQVVDIFPAKSQLYLTDKSVGK